MKCVGLLIAVGILVAAVSAAPADRDIQEDKSTEVQDLTRALCQLQDNEAEMEGVLKFFRKLRKNLAHVVHKYIWYRPGFGWLEGK